MRRFRANSAFSWRRFPRSKLSQLVSNSQRLPRTTLALRLLCGRTRPAALRPPLGPHAAECETCRTRSGTPAPTVPGFAGTVPTCRHKPLESHFVEKHLGASRKTRPASVSSVPARTTAALPSPGSSPPSETSVSFLDRFHPLPSAATPAVVGPGPIASDTADRLPAPCSPPSQTAAPLGVLLRSHRLVPPPPQNAC